MTRKKSPRSSMELFDSSLTVICRGRTLLVVEASLSLVLLNYG